jgi:hypothetical protein
MGLRDPVEPFVGAEFRGNAVLGCGELVAGKL